MAEKPTHDGLSPSLFAGGLLMILLLTGGGFFYVRQTITTAASGYGVSALERRAEELRTEEATLRYAVAELQSLRRLEERVRALHLVPIQTLSYTTPVLRTVVTGQIPVGTASR